MGKLQLTDSGFDILMKMSDGNPGCLTFLMELAHKDSMLLCSVALKLDSAELYGSEVYMLWNDCCDRDIDKTVRMIKKLDYKTLRSYVVDRGYGAKYVEAESSN